MRHRGAKAWPLLAAALAPAASAAQDNPEDGRAGWMFGLGMQADEHDARSLLATSYLAVGSRNWLTFAAGDSSSPTDSADIEASTLLVGIDHRFDKIGLTLEAEKWGDSDALETTDFSGGVYLERDRWRVGLGYEWRDIEIPFTVTGPLGGTFQRTVEVAADGLSFDLSVGLPERWRFYAGLKEFDYERNLNVLPRVASLNWLSASTLTLANSFLDHDRWFAVERRFGRATSLNVRAATDRSAVDGAELDTIEAAVLFPVGRRLDLEVNLGYGGSDFFETGMYGGLLLVVYGP